MKTLALLAILCVSIHFAYTSSIHLVNNDAAIDAADETEDQLFVPNEESADTSEFGVEMWEARQCFPGTCNAHCQRLGHARGVCIGNFCQCRLRSSTLTNLKKDEVQEDKPTNYLGCNILSCMDLCRRLGFRYFRCNINSCTCWN